MDSIGTENVNITPCSIQKICSTHSTTHTDSQYCKSILTYIPALADEPPSLCVPPPEDVHFFLSSSISLRDNERPVPSYLHTHQTFEHHCSARVYIILCILHASVLPFTVLNFIAHA